MGGCLLGRGSHEKQAGTRQGCCSKRTGRRQLMSHLDFLSKRGVTVMQGKEG